MTAQWLRERFPAGQANGSVVIDPEASEYSALTPAAVLLPLVMRDSGLFMLLTQRTAHLRDHAGQVSFPGGHVDAADSGPVHTALREANEEVGLRAEQVEVLGVLPDYATGTGFCITPVVGLVAPPLNLRLADFEVADVFETPLEFLMEPTNYRREKVFIRGKDREYWTILWQNYRIWGATAAMIVSLQRYLFGNPA